MKVENVDESLLLSFCYFVCYKIQSGYSSKIQDFWDVTICRLVKRCQSFERS
jgi:hypothetical protein